MKLFLVRHGHALADKDDARRALSARGHEVTKRVAAFLRPSRALAAVQAVWHSPLVRSRETAELLVKELGLDVLLIETPGLLPEDDPVAVADRLERADQVVMIVGHEPQLGALATLLVRGKLKPVGFDVRKSAVLAFETTGGQHKKTGRARWCLRWHLSPELLSAGGAEAED
ncbi:MAG: phosphohistidine phosphatase SixA [Opitutaceae bacterium]